MKINWDTFKVKNEDYKKSFQELSYFLFCRKFNRASEGILAYKNQVGIETEPIQSNGNLIGFQAKWFESEIDEDNIIKSIEKAKSKNPKLDKIIFYINKEFSESSKKGVKKSKKEKKIENKAGKLKITIEWISLTRLQTLLNQPLNLDLAQLYFDASDEFGFITSCSDPKRLTFLQSSEYINLPIINLGTTQNEENIETSILKSLQKDFIILGHPGSGKSILIHKIFQVYAGLNKENLHDMRTVLQNNKAIPMLINLKDCAFDTIENIIRNRKNDYKIQNNNLQFIYLLDGLDEINVEKADDILSYLYKIKENDSTKKIIFSCRSGNINKIKIKSYFRDIIEYKIDNLTKSHIQKYFCGKNKKSKQKLLRNLSNNNKQLLLEIKDILLVKLFWDTIEKLDEASTIFDLLDKKINLLINEPQHKKNIEELNLLNSKENKIIELNREISFYFQKRFQFRLEQSDIQKIILEKYPRMNYKEANKVLDYIATLFFDIDLSPLPDVTKPSAFVYQHRRYQEFFFIQYLAKAYEKNPKILREYGMLSNENFFENFFLYYLRDRYKKERNLPGIIELNLIDVYLGNHSGYGADDPYYQDSFEFISSLAIQDELVFQELINSESLAIRDKIFIDLIEIERKIKLWKKENNNNNDLTNFLKKVWSVDISSLIKNIVIFWRFDKKEIAKKLTKDLDKARELFRKYHFLEVIKKDKTLEDPFWDNQEDYLFICIAIKRKNLNDIFSLIQDNYRKKNNRKLLKAFFKTCIKTNQQYFFDIIKKLNNDEFLILLNVLALEKIFPFLMKNKDIFHAVKSKVINIKTAENIFLDFFKKIFNIEISETDRIFLQSKLTTLREEHPSDWNRHKVNIQHAVISYALSENSNTANQQTEYLNHLTLYSILFKDYIELVMNNTTIEALTVNYIQAVNRSYPEKNILKKSISVLWAYIFSHYKGEFQKLLNTKNILITEGNIDSFSFYLKLQKLNLELFKKLINKSELQIFERELKNWKNDFPSYVKYSFNIASLFAYIDKQKPTDYIMKGINNSMIRHGWRKDSIVSYGLIETLEVFWENNWISIEKLKDYTRKIFDLTLRVWQITDGKGTQYGPNNIIALASKYDINLAIDLKKILQEKKRRAIGFLNIATSSILRGKIMRGFSIEKIKEGMNEYIQEYRYDGNPNADYYEEKFKIYLIIAQSEFYTKNERKDAFTNAYQQIEKIKEEKLTYSLRDISKETKEIYIKLCKKYRKTINLTIEENTERIYQETKISEIEFVKKLKKVQNKKELSDLYKTLKNYENNIVLSKEESWKLLIEKTYSINNNTELFIDLLRINHFPHFDGMTSNSKYLYIGLGFSLENINTKEEIMQYLFDKTTGHDGFVNVIKSYGVIGDKEMCLKLFKRYLQFCDFLVN